MNPILWPSCKCSPDLARRIPEILRHEGYSVREREMPANPKGIPTFHYEVSDGLRRLTVIGATHHADPKVIVLFRPKRRLGWRLHALFGREKFAMAVIESLVRHGAIKSPLPDEAKLRFLAKSEDTMRARHAQMMLAAVLRERNRTKKPE
jgi:hypothetical protein